MQVSSSVQVSSVQVSSVQVVKWSAGELFGHIRVVGHENGQLKLVIQLGQHPVNHQEA